jgi:hypothetical protein
LWTSTKKEKDGPSSRVDEGGGEVAWGAKFKHGGDQEGKGRRKVEVSGLHYV